MKTDGGATGYWKDDPRPSYPHLTYRDRQHGGKLFHIRFTEATAKAYEEICVHRDMWGLCSTAERTVPPCIGAYLYKPVTPECPSKLERKCAVYCMNRIAGKSELRARLATGIPVGELGKEV